MMNTCISRALVACVWVLVIAAPARSLAASAPVTTSLLQRAERALDLKEIERLQRTYGYYIDQSDWDNVVDLLTDDATAEYALAGVYVGKQSIRGLLYGVGYGKRWLRPRQLREHTQLQPVITLSPDGNSARGRWRAIVLLGQHEEYARWQIGPYENEYRKESGKWKISKIHWYETFTVPFKGGWKGAMTQTNVADRRLPPADRPASFTYAVWPTVHLPPWGFEHPVRNAARSASAVVAQPVTFSKPGSARQLARLEQAVTQLEDEQAIEILQRTYGYYVDKNLWKQIGELFTADGTLEIGGRGVFVGRPRVVQYLEWLGSPVHGRLYDHTQMQAVVHVSPDGKVAKGRWRALVFGGDYGAVSVFGDCIYENEYRKIDGKWMISRLHSYFVMYTDLDKGWGTRAWPNTRPEQALPPDRPPTVVYDMYPGTITAPMHYENPVTGKPPYDGQRVPAMATASVEDLAARLARLEDARAIEYLHNAYAYYLDRWQWDDVADLFAANGSIEYAQRGVYVGKARVRKSLELFGPQGLHQGELFDHAQYQPVVHVAADGMSAKARVREFSMEGRHGADASIGGGIYENDYVKEGGVWKISALHLYTTFVADLEKGWSHGPRPAAGADAALPPDRPPSMRYQSFPLYYTQPFHYPNPVTGVVHPVR
jgi:hypothetical protein